MIGFEEDNISGMKILVVDDVLDNLSILGHFLQKSGLDISVAQTGEKAFELVGQNKPDLILLDIRMPGIDGYEVCKKLKDDVGTKDTPVIFITALAGTEDIIRGFNAGGVDYITKPFQEKEVVCRITTQLKLKKAQDEIKRREKFYRIIVERVPDLIFQLDPDRKIVFANPAFRLLGYDPDQLVGQSIGDLIESSDKENLLKDLATHEVGPLASSDLEVILKVSEDVSLVDEMSSQKILVDSVGIWNVSDEDVFRENVDKKFLGTLCVGKKVV